jgi:demethylmenaquinone methyltransferase/2-methoxy-6-polyprenyl-1,4-benzoquinol methylase
MRMNCPEKKALARDSHMSATPMENSPSKVDSPQMFDRISGRYDLLNHLLSFGQDFLWRRRVSRTLRKIPHDIVVDLACGTCDQILSAFKQNPDIRTGLAVDMAGRMLRIGSNKVETRGLNERIRLVRGDGMDIPLADDSVDCAMISFGIRNFVDADRSLVEFHRILKPGGSLAVLEFSLPKNRFIRMVYLLYFRHVLPWAGAVTSGDRHAYKYLNETVEDFYRRGEFCAMMRNAGFGGIEMTGLTFGAATIYIGKKR